MLLRNYDNLVVAHRLVNNSMTPPLQSVTTYDDESLTVKDMNGKVQTLRYYYRSSTVMPFMIFQNGLPWYAAGDGQCGACSIIASDDTTNPSYDDYTMPYFDSSKVSYIAQSFSDIIYNSETKTWERTVYQTILARTDLTINSIGVYQANEGNSSPDMKTLLFRKKLDAPVVVPANANFVLAFTTIVSANSNKPADYDASAVVVE